MKLTNIEEKVSKTGKNYKKIEVLDSEGKTLSGSFWGEQELVIGEEYDFKVVHKDSFINFNLGGYAKTPQQYLRDKQTSTKDYPTTHPMTLERIEKLEAQVRFIAKKLGLETSAPKTEIEQMVADLPPVGEIPF